MNELERFLKETLNITNRYETDSETLQVDLRNSDDFGVKYSKLSKNNEITELEENSLTTEKNSVITFVSKDARFIITLKGDYESDIYSLVITHNRREDNA